MAGNILVNLSHSSICPQYPQGIHDVLTNHYHNNKMTYMKNFSINDTIA
jgi:hypothetical protein